MFSVLGRNIYTSVEKNTKILEYILYNHKTRIADSWKLRPGTDFPRLIYTAFLWLFTTITPYSWVSSPHYQTRRKKNTTRYCLLSAHLHLISEACRNLFTPCFRDFSLHLHPIMVMRRINYALFVSVLAPFTPQYWDLYQLRPVTDIPRLIYTALLRRFEIITPSYWLPSSHLHSIIQPCLGNYTLFRSCLDSEGRDLRKD